MTKLQKQKLELNQQFNDVFHKENTEINIAKNIDIINNGSVLFDSGWTKVPEQTNPRSLFSIVNNEVLYNYLFEMDLSLPNINIELLKKHLKPVITIKYNNYLGKGNKLSSFNIKPNLNSWYYGDTLMQIGSIGPEIPNEEIGVSWLGPTKAGLYIKLDLGGGDENFFLTRVRLFRKKRYKADKVGWVYNPSIPGWEQTSQTIYSSVYETETDFEATDGLNVTSSSISGNGILYNYALQDTWTDPPGPFTPGTPITELSAYAWTEQGNKSIDFSEIITSEEHNSGRWSLDYDKPYSIVLFYMFGGNEESVVYNIQAVPELEITSSEYSVIACYPGDSFIAKHGSDGIDFKVRIGGINSVTIGTYSGAIPGHPHVTAGTFYDVPLLTADMKYIDSFYETNPDLPSIQEMLPLHVPYNASYVEIIEAGEISESILRIYGYLAFNLKNSKYSMVYPRWNNNTGYDIFFPIEKTEEKFVSIPNDIFIRCEVVYLNTENKGILKDITTS